MTEPLTERSLAFIASCAEPAKLRQIAENALKQGNNVVREAARRKLYQVLPAEKPGTLEFDVWQSIHALEDTLTAEKQKTTRLSRTRQKIQRDGEAKTVADLVLGRASDGFRMLIERNLTELTFEAVALRHQGRFERHVLDAAINRLKEVGYEVQPR